MPSGAVDTVIFDLGGVLIDWDPRYLYRTLFVDDEPGMERFLAEVANADLERRDGRRQAVRAKAWPS